MAVTDLNSLSQLLGMPIWLFMLLLAWAVVWKGIALWKAAQRKRRNDCCFTFTSKASHPN